MAGFWGALTDGGWLQAERFLAPELRPLGGSIGNGGKGGEGQPAGGHVVWIASLSGGESRVSLRFEVELPNDPSGRLTRCAQSTLRVIRDDWFIERLPVLEPNSCQP